MSDIQRIAGDALGFIDGHPEDHFIPSALEALLRPECRIMVEVAEEIARGAFDNECLQPLLEHLSGGGYVPGPGYLAEMLPDAIMRGQISELALQGWRVSDALRRVAAHMAQDRIDPLVVRELLIDAAGRGLPAFTSSPHAIGRPITPGEYNWALKGADRFDDGHASRAVLDLPYFSPEETQELRGFDQAFTFPTTGVASLYEILKGFSNPWCSPFLHSGASHQNPEIVAEYHGRDLREDKIEPGWHAVAMPSALDIGLENWARLFGGSYRQQEEAVAELRPGWRIASVVEILTWAILHLRHNGELPVGDVVLRARPVGEEFSFSWIVSFGDDGCSLGLGRCLLSKGGSDLGVALSRVPA